MSRFGTAGYGGLSGIRRKITKYGLRFIYRLLKYAFKAFRLGHFFCIKLALCTGRYIITKKFNISYFLYFGSLILFKCQNLKG